MELLEITPAGVPSLEIEALPEIAAGVMKSAVEIISG